MTDTLRTRIAAVLAKHIDRQLTNYGNEREECGCGQQGNATYREHVADTVIRELNLREDYSYPPPRRRYVTEWEPDERL